MAWRKVLAALLIVVAASPAWGAAEPLGSITTASSTAIGNTKLSEGSTVFSGDAISVAANGATRIALAGGAQVEVLGSSSVRLTKADGKIQMNVDRGQAFFHSSGNHRVSALVADATVRPATDAETSAVIQSLSETHAVIAVEKGALLITTAHDGRTFTLKEGEAADLSATQAPQQNGGAVPAGKAAPRIKRKAIVIWTVVILAAGAGVAAGVLVHNQSNISTTLLQNEISPARL